MYAPVYSSYVILLKVKKVIIITPARYIEMLENFLQPQPNELAVDVEDIWFQQDGNSAQRTCYLRKLFRRHISHHSDIPWPARSPDLAPCNFFLWGYMKEVYKHHPCNLVVLKVIWEEIQQIKPAMTVRVIMNSRRHLNSCINTQGHHMEHVAFRK